MTATPSANPQHPQLKGEMRLLKQDNQSLKKEVKSLIEENRQLRRYLDALQMAQSRSPKQEDPRQTHLDFEYTQAVQIIEKDSTGDTDEPEPAKPKKNNASKTVKGLERFDNIPVGQTTVHVPDTVKAHPDQWQEVSRDENFEIVVQPATIKKHVHIYPKYRHQIDRDQPLIKAKASPRFSASFISSSLAIDIVLSKYGEHSTLYRTENRLKQMGASITRQTLSEAVKRFAQWFEPVYNRLNEVALSHRYLQIDETFIRYINGPNKGSGMGYYWAIHKPGGETVLKWIPNRKHENVNSLLQGFTGLLQSDGYEAYENYAKANQHVDLLGCWAHVVRKFRDAESQEPAHSQWVQQQIGSLYRLEARWNQFSKLKESTRKQLRARHSLPLLAQMKTGLDALSADISVRGRDFCKAVKYTLNRWDCLHACFHHGHTRLDNNELENRFRATAIGKKNWLFVGHPEAGEKGAIIYTLLIN